MVIKDLTDKRFGHLVAIKPMEQRLNGGVVWLCQCDCGKQVAVRSTSLVKGATVSCGCWGKQKGRETLAKGRKYFQSHERVENTALCSLTQKIRSDNRTGYKGVMFDKRSGKYRVEIGLNRKRKFLGYFENLEDAATARKQAEEEMFAPVLERYGRKLDDTKGGERDGNKR